MISGVALHLSRAACLLRSFAPDCGPRADRRGRGDGADRRDNARRSSPIPSADRTSTAISSASARPIFWRAFSAPFPSTQARRAPRSSPRRAAARNSPASSRRRLRWRSRCLAAACSRMFRTRRLAGVLLFVAQRIVRVGVMVEVARRSWPEFLLIVITLVAIVGAADRAGRRRRHRAFDPARSMDGHARAGRRVRADSRHVDLVAEVDEGAGRNDPRRACHRLAGAAVVPQRLRPPERARQAHRRDSCSSSRPTPSSNSTIRARKSSATRSRGCKPRGVKVAVARLESVRAQAEFRAAGADGADRRGADFSQRRRGRAGVGAGCALTQVCLAQRVRDNSDSTGGASMSDFDRFRRARNRRRRGDDFRPRRRFGAAVAAAARLSAIASDVGARRRRACRALHRGRRRTCAVTGAPRRRRRRTASAIRSG